MPLIFSKRITCFKYFFGYIKVSLLNVYEILLGQTERVIGLEYKGLSYSCNIQKQFQAENPSYFL